MGGGLGMLFGGGQASSPSAPVIMPAPVRETAAEPEAKAARDEEPRKLRARRGGIAGTILSKSEPEGTNPAAGGILGRIGQ